MDMNLKALLGIALEGEIVSLKPGQSIDQLVAERGYKPKGEKCECGVQHEYTAPNGDRIIVIPEHDEDAEPAQTKPAEGSPDSKRELAKQRALAGLQRRMDDALRIVAILDALRRSINIPHGRRGISDLLNEVTLYAELQELAGKL